MLVDPANGTIKLIDFGVARFVGGSKDVKVMVGTPEFAGRLINYPIPYMPIRHFVMRKFVLITEIHKMWREFLHPATTPYSDITHTKCACCKVLAIINVLFYL